MAVVPKGKAARLFSVALGAMVGLALVGAGNSPALVVKSAIAALPVSQYSADNPHSTSLVISQVYGGGGNAGAPWRNDFVELFNPTASPVTVTNWSVQYASTTGNTWQAASFSGTIPPGGYYLIQVASGGATGNPLPTPDATGTFAMSATAAKVALVNSTTLLTGSCPLGAGVVDFVGYGSGTNCFEGSGVAPTISNTTSNARNGGGCVDTDNNSADFTATSTIVPHNSTSPSNPCTAATPTSTGTVSPPSATSTPGAGGAGLVISQLYGGGGSTLQTPYCFDFIELFNATGGPVSLSGKSVQYASSGNNLSSIFNLPATSIPPGGYYLIQSGTSGTGTCSPLPTPDAITSINLSATSGKVALVNGTALLTCGSAATRWHYESYI